MADVFERSNKRKLRLAAALVCALGIAGCGEKEEPRTPLAAESGPAPQTDTGQDRDPSRPPRGEPTMPAENADRDPRVNARERQAERTVREYVAALDARDGAAVCELLLPGVLAGLELPEPRPGCAESLRASIGYRDPRGLPVWQGARVAGVRLAGGLSDGGRAAKAIATVVTAFADRPEPSVEDDVVYLAWSRSGWLVAKPSSTLYRAVGISDIPPSVLTPPSR